LYFEIRNDSSVGLTDGKQYVAASVGLVSTFSRVNVSIRSPGTTDNLVIRLNWLSDLRNMDMAIVAFRRGRELFSTKALQQVVQGEAPPGKDVDTG
jgi:choline dehydrogenase/5'-oxoaverantin cyclase/versicolorin B synthase